MILAMTSTRSRRLKPLSLLRKSLFFLLLVPALSWATLNPDPGHLVEFEKAKAEFDARNYSSADIHLRNALRKNPSHLPSRLLLGRTLLKLGRAPDAEKELLIALRRGAAKDRVVIPLGNALLLQRKYKDILNRITVDNIANSGRYEVLTLRGRAFREMGKLKEAHRSFDQAIAFNDKQMEAYLGKSRTFSAAGDFATAEKWIDIAQDRDPTSDELLFEKAKLRRRQGDNIAAMELFNQVLTTAPNHMRARLGRASLSLSIGNVERAKSDSEYVHNRIPQDPDAALLYAQALSRLGRADEARKVLRTASDILARIEDDQLWDQPGLLRIAALISLQQGAVDKANFYLDRYVVLVPNEVRVRVISARIKLQLDDTDGAIRMLEPVYRSGTQDVELFSLMGEAYLAAERFDDAQTALEKAARLQPNLPQVNTRLALSKIGAGEVEGVWDDLSAANTATEDAPVTAGIIMTIMLTRSGEYDKALEMAESLSERNPRNPVVNNLVGIVRLGRHELLEARAAFQRTLDIYENYIPAMYNLGLMELEAKRIDSAKEWFDQILKLDPQQSKSLVGLAEISIYRDQYARAISLLEKAIVSSDDSLKPHMRLIDILLLTGDIAEAQRQGSVLAGRYIENAQVFELLAQVELAAGNKDKAVGYFRKAFHYADSDGDTQIRIADQLIKLKDDEAARRPLVIALATDRRLDAQERLVQIALRKGDISTAKILASDVREEHPGSAKGYQLEGRILQNEGAYDEAISLYLQALDAHENREVLLSLYALYDALGRKEEGFALLETWVTKNPEDTIAQRILALSYLKSKRRDDARPMLEKLSETRPNDSLVLASLAQLYVQDDNPDAREMAERALEAAPNWAIALDTYGWVLVRAGESEAGLKYLREAVARDSNPLIRYHLAAALHDLGRDSEALAELAIILRTNPELPWIDSAQQLFDSINEPSQS